jgi:bacterioferritin
MQDVQGDQGVLTVLNEVLTNELTAINQYFLHSRMQNNWGFVRLGHHTYEESIDEMKHADRLIERILFLEGHPNLQRLNPLRIGESVPEQLEADLTVEREARVTLLRGIQTAIAADDQVSRILFEEILEAEEEHIDYLETQLDLVTNLGTQLYLAQQTDPGSSS